MVYDLVSARLDDALDPTRFRTGGPIPRRMRERATTDARLLAATGAGHPGDQDQRDDSAHTYEYALQRPIGPFPVAGVETLSSVER